MTILITHHQAATVKRLVRNGPEVGRLDDGTMRCLERVGLVAWVDTPPGELGVLWSATARALEAYGR